MSGKSGRALYACLLAVLAAAALLRGWSCLQMRGSLLFSDDREESYYEQGVSLLSRGVFSLGLSDNSPRLWRGPVFPAFAALSELPYREANPDHLRLAQQLLSLLAAAFAFWLGARYAGAACGLVGAALFALDPGQIISANSLNVHAFYGIALLAVVGAAALWTDKPDRARGLALGGVFGATLLTRSTHFLAFPLILAAGAWRADGWRPALRRALWPAAGLALALAPWTFRNAIQFRRFAPLDSDSGAVNFYAASVGETKTYQIVDAVALAESERPGLQELYRSERDPVFPILLKLALRHVLSDPFRYAKTTVERFVRLYGDWWPALLIAAFGVWRRRRSRAVLAVAGVAASLAAYSLIAVQSGYADAARPLVAILTGWGLVALAEAARHRRSEPERPRAAAVAAAVFLAFMGAAFVFAEAAVIREPFIARPPGPGRPGYLPTMDEGRMIALLREFARRSPRSDARLELAHLLEGSGHRAEACVVFEDNWRSFPNDFETGVAVADCRASAGRGGEAEKITRGLLANSKALGSAAQARASISLARALTASGKKNAGAEQWARALIANPENRAALTVYRRLLAEGRGAEAARLADRESTFGHAVLRAAPPELFALGESPTASLSVRIWSKLNGSPRNASLSVRVWSKLNGAFQILKWAVAMARWKLAAFWSGLSTRMILKGGSGSQGPVAKGDESARFQTALVDAGGMLAAGRRDEARTALDALGVPAGEDAAARVVMLVARGKAKAAAGDFAGAEADLRSGVSASRQDFEARASLVQFLRERGRLAESLGEATALIALPKIPPHNRAEKWLQRSETLMRLGRYDDAAADVRRALEEKHDDIPSLWLMAQVLLRSGRASAAVPFADRMVAAAADGPDRAHAFSQRAQIREALRDARGAASDRRAALSADPRDHVALESLVQRLRAEGRLAEALAAADRMVAAGAGAPASRRAVLLEQRAQVKRQRGDAAGAEADLRAALAVISDSLPPMRGLAELLLASGRPAEALPLLDAAVSGDSEPSSRAASLTLRARVLLALGRRDAAAADLRAAASGGGAGSVAEASAIAAAAAKSAKSLKDALPFADIMSAAAADARLGAAGAESWGRYAGWLAGLREKNGGGDALAAAEHGLGGALTSAPPEIRAGALTARGALRWDAGDQAGALSDFSAAMKADRAAACRRAPLVADPARLPASYFEDCLRLFPRDPVLLANQGFALWRDGAPARALAAWRAALAADPGNLAAALSLRAALGAAGDAESRALLAAALRLSREAKDSPLRKAARESLAGVGGTP
jgi:tetratricopeptide (TPR) repeat protein